MNTLAEAAAWRRRPAMGPGWGWKASQGWRGQESLGSAAVSERLPSVSATSCPRAALPRSRAPAARPGGGSAAAHRRRHPAGTAHGGPPARSPGAQPQRRADAARCPSTLRSTPPWRSARARQQASWMLIACCWLSCSRSASSSRLSAAVSTAAPLQPRLQVGRQGAIGQAEAQQDRGLKHAAALLPAVLGLRRFRCSRLVCRWANLLLRK